jgi:hypothetical protein
MQQKKRVSFQAQLVPSFQMTISNICYNQTDRFRGYAEAVGSDVCESSSCTRCNSSKSLLVLLSSKEKAMSNFYEMIRF